jgi:hypothetical protein
MSARSKLFFSTFFLSALSLQALPPSCRPLNSFEQGQDLRQSQMTAAYNASARIDVRGSWDLYTTGSFIYWQPREENLELGIANTTSIISPLSIDGRVINMDFHYKPGFKAGIGLFSDRDNWDSYFEYTWFTGHHTTHAKAPTGGQILPFWGHPDNYPPLNILSAKSRWVLEMTMVDAQLARIYYVGAKLAFRPYFAARAAWIRQNYSAVYYQDIIAPYHVTYSSHSWGLVPKAGLTADWLLGCGFRAIGTADFDILFTRYNLHIKEQDSGAPSYDAIDLHQRHSFYLRPHSNLELGFGWGSYFDNHNYHFDILGTYGFQVFWNQNMFRFFASENSQGKSFAPNGDLYIHGVNGEMRLDF